MQRAFWYTGLAGGGMAAFLSLVLVGSFLVNGITVGGNAPADGGVPAATDAMDHGSGG